MSVTTTPYSRDYPSGNYSTPSCSYQPALSRYRTNRPRTAGGRPRTGVSTAAGDPVFTAALTESRGVAANIGLCFVSVSTGECILCEIQDSQTYVRTMHKLSVFDPNEILIPMTAMGPQKSKLARIVEENLPGATIIPVARKYFSEQAGMELIEQLAIPEDLPSAKISVNAKFYALSAAAALLQYTSLHNPFVPGSLRIKYQGSDGSMLIDFNSIRNLELIQNLVNPRSTLSLFGILIEFSNLDIFTGALNATVTPMGARLLRANVLQPLTDVSTINARLDAVQELLENEDMFFGVQTALKSFPDLDRLLTSLLATTNQPSLKHSEQRINDIIVLKHCLKAIVPVYQALEIASCNLLVAIRDLCSDGRIQDVQNLIDSIINEDTTYSKGALSLRNQRCYAVKSGVNGLLDVARQTYKETISDTIELSAQYRDEQMLPIHSKFESSRGFYLTLLASEVDGHNLDPNFINVFKKKKTLEFTTLELVKKNAKIRDSLDEVLLMSDNTIEQLTSDIRKEIGALYKTCEGLAMLDMIMSFAHNCTIRNYVRPEFTDTLAIKGGRHPIRETSHTERFIPNDVYMTQTTRFQIITGCNMSGKSTFLRQVALLTIMSQTGSLHVISCISIVNGSLFTRISMDDSIEVNSSTFALEMRETAFILQNVSKGSLVVIDELGRGTSNTDGVAITMAVCEGLVETRAHVLFATHFIILAKILENRSGVVNLHMEVETNDDNNLKMIYKITDGYNEEKHYGVKLLSDLLMEGLGIASIIPLPAVMFERAMEVSRELTKQADAKREDSRTGKIVKRRKMLLNLKELLIQAQSGVMDEQALWYMCHLLWEAQIKALVRESSESLCRRLQGVNQSRRSDASM
ncbi:MutS 4 [Neolecta irregularis DAH-3]|uniref:DNA mismatch repair protein MSH3 n=1 Tax=Neolecta irregularis (strain DAH-3) TaxID=1198029 RepID=A0A1U7LMA1_NEOID|nr:MutS 4 [Neolecta irregularis DAH-3]|eukprot:OLL23713.1 MutS 4 [Neolecta irregularis DAH-3]